MREPFDLWGSRGWYNQEVVGESQYFATLQKIIGVPALEWTEVTTVAHLVPEPTNRYDRNAVQVLIGGHIVGYLPREDAARYVTVLANLCSHGWLPQVPAQVRGGLVENYDLDEHGRERKFTEFVGSVLLDLNEPHLLVPANRPPDVEHVMLPPGNAIQVTGEENYLNTLVPLIGPAGETWIHVTLHEVSEQTARTTKTLVEVRVDGQPAGRLTPKMSAELLPAIRYFADRGLVTAGRAILKGNALKADITLYVARAGELSQEFLATNGTSARSLAAPIIPGQAVPAQHASPAQEAMATPVVSWRFNPPPGWPAPPPGWVPPPGWIPPPYLPPAPPGWQWWVPAQ